MQTATQSRSYIIGKDMLDACLYRPLERLDLPVSPKFERVAAGGLFFLPPQRDKRARLAPELRPAEYILYVLRPNGHGWLRLPRPDGIPTENDEGAG